MRTDVAVIGILPPPVHGHAVATQHFARLLESAGLTVSVTDVGPSAGPKLLAHLKAAIALLQTEAPIVYLSVHDRAGMYLTAALAWLARRKGKQLLLHHHSRRYTDRYRYRMVLLHCCAGPAATQLVQGRSLEGSLSRLYGIENVLPFSNVGIVDPVTRSAKAAASIRLGHFANLTRAKGIGEAIAVLERCLSDGRDAELMVAGPTLDRYAARSVASAARRFPGHFKWIGPLDEGGKAGFFRSIDVLLSPSNYAAETQGIVNLEALAAGVPVIAKAVGCIADDLGNAGRAVPLGENYVEAALAFIEQFRGDPAAASGAAKARYWRLRQAHATEIAALLDLVGAPLVRQARAG